MGMVCKKMKCTKCGDELDSEEEELSYRDKSGNIRCDYCFCEDYVFLCPICEELFLEDFSEDISPEYLLVTKNASESLYVVPGIYKIIAYPFYRDGITEMSLIKTAIRKIANIPKDICADGIHYICKNCGVEEK